MGMWPGLREMRGLCPCPAVIPEQEALTLTVGRELSLTQSDEPSLSGAHWPLEGTESARGGAHATFLWGGGREPREEDPMRSPHAMLGSPHS